MPYRPPPGTGDFVGRAAAVAELTVTLASGRAVPVAVVSGMGGVGKTALAVHVAHALGERFPGGLLYVDLRGMADRPASPHAVLGGLLCSFGHTTVPDGTEERAALYRSELAVRRVLVLLDDARSTVQVGPLLPGASGSAVLVTSRSTMAGLPGARHVDLSVLEPYEALALLTSVAGAGRVAAERRAALDLVAACGFLPLAIRGAGTLLANRPSLRIGALARRLTGGALEELPGAVSCFAPGYDLLGPDEARAFRLLALADGPGFSTGAAQAVLGLRHQRADELLETLTDVSLLECTAPGRYRFHDLLRQFALHRRSYRGERVGALHGLLGHYLAAARGAARALGVAPRPFPANPGAGDRPARADFPTTAHTTAPTTPEAVRAWLFIEQDAILTAVERSAEEPDGPLVQAAELLLFLAQLLDTDWRSGRMRITAAALRAAVNRQEGPSSRRTKGRPCVTQR